MGACEPVLRRVRSGDGAVLLATYDYGGAGRDVLLMHGNGLHARCYEPLVHVLRAAGLRVVGVDQRGAGASCLSEGGADLRWARFGEDVLAVQDALSLRSCLGFGHSLGGAACLLAEAARPGAFAALYLFEPVVAPDASGGEDEPHPWDEPLKRKVQAALKRRAVFPSRAAALSAYVEKPPLSLLHPTCLRLYVEHGFRRASLHAACAPRAKVELRRDVPGDGVTLCCQPETEAEIFRLGPRSGAERVLPRVVCPVTVGVGGRDTQDGPARVAPTVASRVVRGRLELHEQLGHFGPLEDPEKMAVAALASFALAKL